MAALSIATDVAAMVLVGPDTLEPRRLSRPAVAPDSALIDVELCGVCGTDRKYFAGKLAAPYPLILGHEVVGRVAEIGEVAARRYKVATGDRVIVESSIPCWSCEFCRSGAYRFCPTKGGYGTRSGLATGSGLWGGMAQLVEVAPGSIVHRIPDGISPAAAIGLELLGNGYQWLIRKGGLVPGDRVLIQGCGPQGLCATLVARRLGAREIVVTGLASDTARLAFAAEAGARTVVVDPDAGREAQLAALGGEYDVVLDVTGDPRAVSTAPNHVRPQGTFVLASIVGRGVEVPFRTDDLAYREIRVQGVLSKDERSVLSATALVEADPALAEQVSRLITHVFPLARAEEAIRAREAGLDGFVKAAVDPRLVG
jgi:alcohol dehydrogenase